MIFFFTIPCWVILALALLPLGALGLTVDWLAQNMQVISVVLWGILVLATLFFSEKGKRLSALSCLSLVLPAYVALARCILVVSSYDGLVTLFFKFVSAAIAVIIFGFCSLLLVAKRIELLEGSSKKYSPATLTILSFLISFILSLVANYVCANFV